VEQIAKHLTRVDRVLEQVATDLERLWADTGAYDDTLVERAVPALLVGAVRGGGKRLRPTMSYLGWLAVGGPDSGAGYDDVVCVGAALDLLHAFALVHDDIMDESPSRRGSPTTHVLAADLHRAAAATGDGGRFGESTAMLVGDLLLAEAGQLVACLPQPMRTLWRSMVVELVAGQLRDLSGAATRRRDLEHARAVARAKSGAYSVQRPLQLGCLAARGSRQAMDCLTEYGRNVGEAFALRDDLLGVFGDPAETGKPVGEDLTAGKATVVLSVATAALRATNGRGSNGDSTGDLLDRVGTALLTSDDVRTLQEEFRRRGVVDEVESAITARTEAALAALDPRWLDEEAVQQLSIMAHRIAWRTS
jgi:geranylgeranyl diphosphate synthase, type I